MYNPDVFKQEDMQTLRSWIKQSPFGVLVTHSDAGLVASHLPFAMTEVDAFGGWKLIGHMARANRQWETFKENSDALVIFSGPHGYISPTLYSSGEGAIPTWHYSTTGGEIRHEEPALPTWNYVAVHVHGIPTLLSDKRHILESQCRAHEEHWKLSDLPLEFLEQKETRIVAFEIPVRGIEGKAKLGQRQEAAERANVASQLAYSDCHVMQLAELMKKTS